MRCAMLSCFKKCCPYDFFAFMDVLLIVGKGEIKNENVVTLPNVLMSKTALFYFMAALLSDETLIQQALNGRQMAFGMLVKRYEQYVFTIALRMMKNRENAHEVAQDSFLRAFRYLPEFRGEAKFSTWLYKIVYTTALNRLRKENPDIVSLDDDERPVKFRHASSADASEKIEKEERNSLINKAISMLSPDDASVITLFYLYEHSLEEICHITDLSMTNAKTKLCRARQRLKSILDTNFAHAI
jgi:RNA polymerase sigma factor (sigma-70 family)